MRLISIIILVSLFYGSSPAQADLLFYADNKAVITVFFNDNVVNSTPLDSVRVSKISTVSCRIKIRYQDSTARLTTERTLYPRKKHTTIYQISRKEDSLIMRWEAHKAKNYKPETVPEDSTGIGDSLSVEAFEPDDFPERDCSHAAMHETRFASYLTEMQKIDFDSDRLIFLKKMLMSECLSAEQARRFAGNLDFDESRLQFFKIAYRYISDKEEYSKIYDAVEYPDIIRMMENYIEQNF